VVQAGRVYLTAAHAETDDLLALCFDLRTGKELWRRCCGKDRPTKGSNNQSAPSAVAGGGRSWFLFGTGSLWSFDSEGKTVWHRELETDYGPFVIKFGYSSSPLHYRDALYIPVLRNTDPARYGGGGAAQGPLASYLLALDADSGRTLWARERPTDAEDESTEGYFTPMPYEGAGRNEIILIGGECVTGHSASSGREIWRWWFTPPDRKIWQRVVTSAVCTDDLIYVVRPKHRPMFALPGGGKGTLDPDWPAWSHEDMTPDVTTPLLYRNRLYALQDTERVMVCFDPPTGRILWQHTIDGRGPFRASPTAAEDRIYCIDQAGEVVVLRAGDAYRELLRFTLGEAPCHGSIALLDGRLLVRTAKNLYCFGRRQP
jgi:outer membrane protein assembly factor BamB